MTRKTMASSLDDFSRREVANLERRFFMKRSLSLGALTLLSGCDVTNQEAVQKVLWQIAEEATPQTNFAAYTQAMMSGALLAVYPDAAGTSRAPPVSADAQHAPPVVSTPSLMNGAKAMPVDSSDMLPLGTIIRYAIISPLSLRHLSYG